MPQNPDSHDSDKTLYRGLVEKLVSGGLGLIRLDGEVIFLPGVLPQEEIEFTLGPKTKGVRRGTVVTIVTASPERQVPPCSYYGHCGGCDLMHLKDKAQRDFKVAMVQENFKRLGKLEIPAPRIYFGSSWNYRSRIQLHKDAQGNVGFMALQSSQIIPIKNCPVVHQALAPLFHSQDQKNLDDKEAAQTLKAFAPGRYNAVATPEGWRIQGKDQLATIKVLDHRFVSSLEGFFQSNIEVLELLVQKILEGFSGASKSLASEGELLDFYCGCGLFGSFLSEQFNKILGVEENLQALNLAKKNVIGPLHEFYGQSLESWINKNQRKKNLPTYLVVDPPRTGLSVPVREFIAKLKPKKMAYVSCNPDTLARDAGYFQTQGLKLSSLELFDFYPQTSHIEALAWFTRE